MSVQLADENTPTPTPPAIAGHPPRAPAGEGGSMQQPQRPTSPLRAGQSHLGTSPRPFGERAPRLGERSELRRGGWGGAGVGMLAHAPPHPDRPADAARSDLSPPGRGGAPCHMRLPCPERGGGRLPNRSAHRGASARSGAKLLHWHSHDFFLPRKGGGWEGVAMPHPFTRRRGCAPRVRAQPVQQRAAPSPPPPQGRPAGGRAWCAARRWKARP